jgi:hypothetical protein
MAENVIDLPKVQREACLKVLTNQEQARQEPKGWYQSTLNTIDFLFWVSPIGYWLNRDRFEDYWTIYNNTK